ncbi:hypothetical protein BGZ58_010642 [Dissophora ornata]|nr:hypothetical protein BGZ58_010642 [Dissophora ornata]
MSFVLMGRTRLRNRETGFDIPAAFFLTKISQKQALEGRLSAMRACMDRLCDSEFKPTVVITDQGQLKINANQAV